MRTPHPARLTLSTAGIAVAVLALAACGGSNAADSSSAASVATSGAAAPSGASASNGRPDFTAYRDCMAKNGVTLPDFQQGGQRPSGAPQGFPSGAPSGAPGAGGPGGGGPGGFPLPAGVDQATFDKAQQACASLQPQFGNGRGPAQIDATALAAFTSCLGDHGVTVPGGQDFMRQLDRTDPKVSAALKTCAPLLPAPGSGTSGSAAASPAASPATS